MAVRQHGLFPQQAPACWQAYPEPKASALPQGHALLAMLGLVLGKALYEGFLIDVPLAPFFAARLQVRLMLVGMQGHTSQPHCCCTLLAVLRSHMTHCMGLAGAPPQPRGPEPAAARRAQEHPPDQEAGPHSKVLCLAAGCGRL